VAEVTYAGEYHGQTEAVAFSREMGVEGSRFEQWVRLDPIMPMQKQSRRRLERNQGRWDWTAILRDGFSIKKRPLHESK
jgi:hypothetical protein